MIHRQNASFPFCTDSVETEPQARSHTLVTTTTAKTSDTDYCCNECSTSTPPVTIATTSSAPLHTAIRTIRTWLFLDTHRRKRRTCSRFRTASSVSISPPFLCFQSWRCPPLLGVPSPGNEALAGRHSSGGRPLRLSSLARAAPSLSFSSPSSPSKVYRSMVALHRRRRCLPIILLTPATTRGAPHHHHQA